MKNTIISNWRYNPPKKFVGSLLPIHNGGNHGFSPSPKKTPDHKYLKRYVKYLKALIDSNKLTKLEALNIVYSRYTITLQELKQLFS